MNAVTQVSYLALETPDPSPPIGVTQVAYVVLETPDAPAVTQVSYVALEAPEVVSTIAGATLQTDWTMAAGAFLNDTTMLGAVLNLGWAFIPGAFSSGSVIPQAVLLVDWSIGPGAMSGGTGASLGGAALGIDWQIETRPFWAPAREHVCITITPVTDTTTITMRECA